MSAERIMTRKDQRRRLFLPPFLLHFCDFRRAIFSLVTTAPSMRCPPHMQQQCTRAEEGRSCQTIAGHSADDRGLRRVTHPRLPSRSNVDSDKTRVLGPCACMGAHQRAPSSFKQKEAKGRGGCLGEGGGWLSRTFSGDSAHLRDARSAPSCLLCPRV